MLSLKPRLTTRNTMLAVVAVIVTLIMVSIAHPQETLKSVDSVTVVDANGKKVGQVIGVSQTPMVAFDLNKSIFFLFVRPNRLAGTGGYGYEGLFFDTLDCSGTAYLPEYEVEEFLVPAVVVNKPGHTLYINEPNSTPQLITPQSMLGYTEETYNQCTNLTIPPYNPPPPGTRYFPALPVVDFDTLFTPPFKLQAGPKDKGQGKDKGKGNG